MPDKLAGLHPSLLAKVTQIINAMRELGFDMRVTDGLRTADQQHQLWLKGRQGNAGPIVTNADGYQRKSNHQVQSDGFGHAADLTFWRNGAPTWDVTMPWTLYGEMAESIGLQWGGKFLSFADRPHVELPLTH